tara:strand:+ start:470 stop:613 length:144 start_codon:yes stop_codon:yes gene_type:complete
MEELQETELKRRVKELEEINENHRLLNGELRAEIADLLNYQKGKSKW